MLRIALLKPEHVAAVAAGYTAEWPDWYGPEGAADAVAELEARAGGEALPLGLVALDGDEVIGSVALSEHSVSSHRHLTPWMIGLWTRPSHRRQGVATQLIVEAVALAAARSAQRLFVATHDAPELFKAPNWRLHEAVEYDGRMLMVFVADL